MAMYGCWIRELLTELLQNCNGFFTAHRHPPFLKLRQFRQRRETFINTDTRLFKIQTSDMGPPPHPPGRASSISCRFHCPAKCPIPVHWLLERKSYILMRAKVIYHHHHHHHISIFFPSPLTHLIGTLSNYDDDDDDDYSHIEKQ